MLKLNGNQTIPLIEEVDLLVVGGGLAGLPIAKAYASSGKKVLLVEKGTFLGYEIGQWQRPWVQWCKENDVLLKEWLSFEEKNSEFEDDCILSIPMDKFKLKMEDCLIDAGVNILYASIPTGCIKLEDGWQVTIANKSGRQAIKAGYVIDVSARSIIARLMGKKSCVFYPVDAAYNVLNDEKKEVVRRTLEFTGIESEVENSISRKSFRYEVPESLGVWQNMISIYQGAFDEGHMYLDIPIAVDKKDPSLENDTYIEYKVRKVSLEVASWVIHNLPSFILAKIGLGSLEVVHALDFDPTTLLKTGESIGRKLLDNEFDTNNCIILSCTDNYRNIKSNIVIPSEVGSSIVYSEHTEFNKLHRFTTVEAELSVYEALDQVDVLVVGGGTSGAVSARVAAQEGVRTTLLEMNTALGGTGTVGGVHYHWFSYRNGFTGEIDNRINEYAQKLLHPNQKYYWGMNDVWSMELKAFVLLEMCMEQGTNVLFNCINFGTLMEGNCVVGVTVATPYGPYVFRAKVIIDATGDGDIAAFAGAECLYGNERDPMTMSCSMAQFKSPGLTKGNFATTLDVGDVFDYTRFILVGRRRGFDGLHDHATYVTPRESRHVRGEIMLTLTDQMLLRRYPDTVSLCFSNHDPKGKSAADIIYFGLLPPHLQIEVPYRAMIPVVLEQILITGKAISSTHDALAAIRMQGDLQQQGGAVGLAAALCIKYNVSPRKLNVKYLQKKLIKLDIIPERVLDYIEKEEEFDFTKIINELTGEEPFEWMDMSIFEKLESISPIVIVCAAKSEEVVTLLLNNFENSKGNLKLLLARLLLWHGQEIGLDTVISEINRQLDDVVALPFRKASIRWCQTYPDHGVMTEVTYLVNTLSRAPSRKSIPLLEKLANRITKVERDYKEKRQCMFNYIESVSYCAERLAYRELVPLLELLLGLPELQDSVQTDGLELDILGERLSYLVISLSRAMARCGSREGLTKLAAFVVDNRILIARCATDELVTLTGKDFGNDFNAWIEYINKYPDSIETKPWCLTID